MYLRAILMTVLAPIFGLIAKFALVDEASSTGSHTAFAIAVAVVSALAANETAYWIQLRHAAPFSYEGALAYAGHVVIAAVGVLLTMGTFGYLANPAASHRFEIAVVIVAGAISAGLGAIFEYAFPEHVFRAECEAWQLLSRGQATAA